MNPRPLRAREAVQVVASREFRERTATRGFRWGTGIMMVFVAALAVLPRLLPDQSDPEWTVLTVGPAPAGLVDAVGAIAAAQSATVHVRPAQGEPDELARQPDVDAVLVDGRELVAESEIPPTLQGAFSNAIGQLRVLEALGEYDISAERAAELLTPEPLATRTLEASDQNDRSLIAFAGSVLMFAAILTYGGWVQYSVLEEKANRIVELVVSAVRPAHLLAGKLIAVGTIGLCQLAALVTVGVGASALAGTLPDLPPFVPGLVAWALVWFLLGFAFYAVGYAAAGALTSRQEDAQSAAAPILTMVMSAYFISIFVVAPAPDSTAARVISLIPLFAPIAMPARLASGDVPVWEVAVSISLMLVGITAMVWVAGRIYERALLHTGARVPFRRAVREVFRVAD